MAGKINLDNLQKASTTETNESVKFEEKSLAEKIALDLVNTTGGAIKTGLKEYCMAIDKGMFAVTEWLNDRYGRGDTRDPANGPDYITEWIKHNGGQGIHGVEKLKNEHIDALVDKMKELAAHERSATAKLLESDHHFFVTFASGVLESLERSEVMQKTGWSSELIMIREILNTATEGTYNSQVERDRMVAAFEEFAKRHNVELARQDLAENKEFSCSFHDSMYMEMTGRTMISRTTPQTPTPPKHEDDHEEESGLTPGA